MDFSDAELLAQVERSAQRLARLRGMREAILGMHVHDCPFIEDDLRLAWYEGFADQHRGAWLRHPEE